MISLRWRKKLVRRESFWVDMTGESFLQDVVSWGKMDIGIFTGVSSIVSTCHEVALQRTSRSSALNADLPQGRLRRMARSTMVPQPRLACLLSLHALHTSPRELLLHRRSRQRAATAVCVPIAPRVGRGREERQR